MTVSHGHGARRAKWVCAPLLGASFVCLTGAGGELESLAMAGAQPTHAPAMTAPMTARQRPLSAMPITARVTVPPGPGWLGIGFGSVWLSKSERRALLRIDPVTNRVVATIPVGSDPELGIGIGLGFVWIADTKDHSLSQIDPNINKVVRVVPVNVADDPEGSIGVGEGSIWLLTNDHGTESGTLTRVDAISGESIATIDVKPQSHAVIVAFGSVWVSNSADSSVQRIDPRKNAVVANIPVRALPRFLAAGVCSLWVLTQGDGSLARIDPRSNRVMATVAVGVPGEGGDLAVAGGLVWVSGEGVPLSMIDPRSNRLAYQFVGGRKDDTLRVGFGSAWVVAEEDGEVWRIDLRNIGQF